MRDHERALGRVNAADEIQLNGLRLYHQYDTDLKTCVVMRAEFHLYPCLSHYTVVSPVMEQWFTREAGMEKSTNYVIQCVEGAKFEIGVDFMIQPIFDLSHFSCIGGEVLVRGTHRRKIVPPALFIRQLEENGTIVDMGYYVMEKALQFIALKHADSHDEYLFTLNISTVQLNAADFAHQALAIVARSQLSPSRLVFEVTQSAMALTSTAQENLRNLSEAGINIAWDGISNITVLRERLEFWPPDFIKLDRVCLASSQSEATEQMVQLINDTDADVIIEGVENYGHISGMLRQGVKYGQGYLFSRPLSKENFQHEYMQHQRNQASVYRVHRHL